jgi:hypothetical protein
MASYSAYKWVPWQLFCSCVDSGTHCFKTTGTGFSAKTTPFSANVALNGLWFTGANQKADVYLPCLASLDITASVYIGIEFFLALTPTTSGTAQFDLKYAIVDKGPGGTLLDTPTLTALTVPLFTNPGTSGWAGRMFTITELEIPGYTFTSPYQGLLLEVSSNPGSLFTETRVSLQGLSIYYSSLVMES